MKRNRHIERTPAQQRQLAGWALFFAALAVLPVLVWIVAR